MTKEARSPKSEGLKGSSPAGTIRHSSFVIRLRPEPSPRMSSAVRRDGDALVFFLQTVQSLVMPRLAGHTAKPGSRWSHRILALGSVLLATLAGHPAAAAVGDYLIDVWTSENGLRNSS